MAYLIGFFLKRRTLAMQHQVFEKPCLSSMFFTVPRIFRNPYRKCKGLLRKIPALSADCGGVNETLSAKLGGRNHHLFHK